VLERVVFIRFWYGKLSMLSVFICEHLRWCRVEMVSKRNLKREINWLIFNYWGKP